MKGYSGMSKGHQTAMLIEVIVALLAIGAAIVTMMLSENETVTVKEQVADVETSGTETTGLMSETLPTESASETEAQTETESVPETETQSIAQEETTETSGTPTVSYDFPNTVFIGDSRILSLATGGQLEYALVPNEAVNATWGGVLYQNEAFENAQNAALKGRSKAVFWYGINDVQVNPDRDNAAGFIANYDAVIQTYRQANPNSEIYILSILNTSVYEKDYYEGQDMNVMNYNAEIAKYCGANGFRYIDITSLLTGEECFVPEDHIHFTKAWYENSFLPVILNAVTQ